MSSAAPEPFPVPQTAHIKLSPDCFDMNGSKNLSMITPPDRPPIGIVKNCNVLRQEYTRPCISAGIVSLKTTSRFAPMNGMNIQTQANKKVEEGCDGGCAACGAADNCDKKEAKA